MILLLSSGCFPHSGQFSPHHLSKANPPGGSESSLFTREELDKLFSPERVIAQALPSPSAAELATGELLYGGPSPSINEECNNDFQLEVFPKEHTKGNAEFDIPIVVNAKVEQFVQYFQTTLKSQFANWLARSEK